MVVVVDGSGGVAVGDDVDDEVVLMCGPDVGLLVVVASGSGAELWRGRRVAAVGSSCARASASDRESVVSHRESVDGARNPKITPTENVITAVSATETDTRCLGNRSILWRTTRVQPEADGGPAECEPVCSVTSAGAKL
ncbi:MAG: hypothetical protein KatS3mg008_1380 [Acidimicrobiales bacterium]|nr:MAG: hypothetical protein KatS3mg008_1380 [Acidimicrobiales bacterium]